MKPEVYWHEEFSKCSTPAEDDAVVRAIQADALRHAAEIAKKEREAREANASMSHIPADFVPVVACHKIEMAIEAEANKLDPK